MNHAISREESESAGILELTKQMLVLAQAGEWDELFAVETVRSRQINQMQFSESDRLMIEQVLQIDDKVRGLVEAERSELLNELKILNKGKNAINAYAS